MRPHPTIGILVVASTTASELDDLLSRIPRPFRSRIAEVIVFDDDGVAFPRTAAGLPLTVLRDAPQPGHGGHQKSGYRLAVDHGLDIVVLLPTGGKYAPELLAQLVAPIVDGHADAVLGSRLLARGTPRRAGLLHRLAGIKLLTGAQNALAGTDLSDYQSGYRAYRMAAVRQIDLDANSDGVEFDTQLLLQLHGAGERIVEVPVADDDGDEPDPVEAVRYGRDVLKPTLDLQLARAGFNAGLGAPRGPYEHKPSAASSHGRILAWMDGRDAAKILDVGCSSGELGWRLRQQGHYVLGIDIEESGDVVDNLDEFVRADLDRGLPASLTGEFDVIVCADTLEHLRRPAELLAGLHRFLQPGGRVLASVPNFAHWYPRLRVVTGHFDYDRRGILDAGHLRFFTDRTFRRAAASAGFTVTRRDAVGLPFDAVGSSRRFGRVARLADQLSVRAWPSLFAYQYLYELAPTGDDGWAI